LYEEVVMNFTDTKKPKVTPEKKLSILLIEHDPELRKVIKLTLEQNGMKVVTVERFSNALQVLEQGDPDLFLVDFDLTDGDPGELIEQFRRTKEDRGAVMLTTTSRPDDHWRRTYQPDAVVYKPFDIRHLYKRILALEYE
jgi:two-component system KDP operon response regulator KdpE